MFFSSDPFEDESNKNAIFSISFKPSILVIKTFLRKLVSSVKLKDRKVEEKTF